MVKKLARIETSSICRQQFANMFANCLSCENRVLKRKDRVQNREDRSRNHEPTSPPTLCFLTNNPAVTQTQPTTFLYFPCQAQQCCQLRHVISLWRLLTLERARLLIRRGEVRDFSAPNCCFPPENICACLLRTQFLSQRHATSCTSAPAREEI